MIFNKEEERYIDLVKEMENALKDGIKTVLDRHDFRSEHERTQAIKATLTAACAFITGLTKACCKEPDEMMAAIAACLEIEFPGYSLPSQQQELLVGRLKDVFKSDPRLVQAAQDKNAPSWIKKAFDDYKAETEAGLDAEPSEDAMAQGNSLMSQVFGKKE